MNPETVPPRPEAQSTEPDGPQSLTLNVSGSSRGFPAGIYRLSNLVELPPVTVSSAQHSVQFVEPDAATILWVERALAGPVNEQGQSELEDKLQISPVTGFSLDMLNKLTTPAEFLPTIWNALDHAESEGVQFGLTRMREAVRRMPRYDQHLIAKAETLGLRESTRENQMLAAELVNRSDPSGLRMLNELVSAFNRMEVPDPRADIEGFNAAALGMTILSRVGCLVIKGKHSASSLDEIYRPNVARALDTLLKEAA